MDDLARVFTRLAANHIALKPVKCLFGTHEMVLLGHEVLAKMGIRPEREKVKAILEMTLPQTVDVLHGFVGATSWVSKHIPEYAALVKPLRDIVHSYDKKSRASITHEWSKPEAGATAVRSFEALRMSLASRPCLAFPDFNRPMIIISDASKIALGACLCQMSEEGELRPIAYASTPVKDCEKNLHITVLEGKALTFAVKKWRHMIYATTCICITDHIALKSLTSPTKEFDTKAMARMALTLSEYDLVIAHRPGTSKELVVSDMLSRAGTEKDAAVLESLMKQAWGCIGTLCTDTKLHLSRQMLSSKGQVRRLQHQVDGATIAELVKGKQCISVQDMVRAIEDGDREPKPVVAGSQEEPTRMEEMYDMITSINQLGDDGAELVTDEDVLAAQLLDPFCKQMRLILKGNKQTRVAGDQLHQTCKWQAPYHIVTEDGVLRRLLWTKGKDRDLQIAQGRAPAVVPEAARGLQAALCQLLHEESGHSACRKTYDNLISRYIWTGASADLTELIKTCNQCDYYGDKLAQAPISGHVTASEPAQRIMMDVIHMQEVEGYKYVLVIECIYSRWAMAIPLKNIKAATVCQALRRLAIPAGLGRPTEFLIDGGSEFKAQVQEACRAWGSKWRAHTPHHSQSAGAIERLNKTLELRTAHFGKSCNCTWLDALPLAVEAYNGSIHAGLSKGSIMLSPAELWLGRKLRFNSDVRPTLLDRPTDVQQHGEWLRKHTQQVKDWIEEADASYRERMAAASSSSKLRELEVGDTVELHVEQEKRAQNSGAERWEGPWEVLQKGEMPTDYLIKRLGSRAKPKWEHIDNLKKKHHSAVQQHHDELEEVNEEDVMQTAPKSGRNYDVSRIVGERGRSRSSKHYLVEYKGYDQAWWQPVGNLYCDKKVQDWNMLTNAKRNELTEAADVANPDLVALVMDLRVEKQAQARKLILDVCAQAGISRDRLRAVLGSPPCNSFTKLDAVNVDRGNNFREPCMPFPPRKFDGSEQSRKLGQIAQEHDEMIHNLLLSVVQDKQEGCTYDFCFENPRGMLRHRPYMKEDAWLEISNRCTPDYCAFAHEFQKPTDLWHSFGQSWQPKGTTGDGKCHQKCGAGRYKASGKYAHYKRHAGAAGTGVLNRKEPTVAEMAHPGHAVRGGGRKIDTGRRPRCGPRLVLRRRELQTSGGGSRLHLHCGGLGDDGGSGPEEGGTRGQ